MAEDCFESFFEDDGEIHFDGNCGVPLTDEELINCIDFESDNVQEPITPTKSDGISIVIGMKFSSVELIYELYNTFAYSKGFGIKKRNSRSNYVLYVCDKNGFNPPVKNLNVPEDKQRLSSFSGVGCQAALHAYKENKSNMWKITKHVDVHNHEMVSPNSVTILKSHKDFSTVARSLTEAFSRAGVPIGKVPAIFGTSSVGFSSRDCYNHMAKVRKIMYEAGDAQAIQSYCAKEQMKDPEFYYSIQFDDDSRMLNFFWIDRRSRFAYEKFGDVVSFDTTYRTNKYSMPFAPFVGVNHHMQSTMFGCALLHDEREETFTWLFQTWLASVRGKAPISILTDQDAAMGNAIAKVFPESRHRLCIWHIMKKFPEKLSHIYNEECNFKQQFNRCIHKSKSCAEFENDWQKIMEEYHLDENEWLKSLYSIRASWVPIFNKNTFFAGMNTTQRSESINAFFNAFVKSSTTLREFVVQYDIALDRRYESYRQEEFDSRHKKRRLTLNMPLEEYASSVYTRNVFSKFHEELSASLQFSKEKLSKVATQATYRVWNKKNTFDSYIVSIDFDTKHITCSCMLFESMGILCRHILVIYHMKGIEELPSVYILDRWKKDGNKMIYVASRICETDNNCSLRSFGLRSRYGILDEMANKSDVAYIFIQDSLDSVIAGARDLISQVCTNAETSEHNPNKKLLQCDESSFTLKDPKVSQTKGRKRIRSGVEIAMKTTVICGNCGIRGHNKRGCMKSNAKDQ